ncbi:ribosomal RNA methyltransferase [Plasmodium falciparum RAJ116]|uniref:Ribosomal RNA methyltransferase n=1 Tax=Plasmodium falciparum RAJ116 TaxID=580058 RepID=A0A0L0CXF4_PLAFA|nr:ribosomal RNA methyltransferase [Plasmodium falciparum RAJ116]
MYLGSQTNNLKTYLKGMFHLVHTTKPKASRNESREIYLVCKNFLGRKKITEDVQIKGSFSSKEVSPFEHIKEYYYLYVEKIYKCTYNNIISYNII